MKKRLLIPVIACAVSACTEETPMVSLGLDETYCIARMQKLALSPALTGSEYCWRVDGEKVCDEHDFIFLAQREGEYYISFEIVDTATPYRHDFTVVVSHEEVEYSAYISKVYEYCPAPGQFVNEMPKYEKGDNVASMTRKAQDCISGTNDVMISLGGYGGFVTFGFDHTVVNVAGEYDFRIWGNCFYELTDPERKGGSAEPGIVMVSYDENCNGIPDDAFYELAGSAYLHPDTRRNYGITYYRPADKLTAEGDDSGFLSDKEYIVWKDTEGTAGFMPKNIFHDQSYWPMWIDSDELSFSGTCLPPNAVDTSGSGRYYILYCYDWGYVDNHPNDYGELNSFDIDWAVDVNGNPVKLPGVDFIRVYTGVNQYCGWIGETSTELCRAADLHINQ